MISNLNIREMSRDERRTSGGQEPARAAESIGKIKKKSDHHRVYERSKAISELLTITIRAKLLGTGRAIAASAFQIRPLPVIFRF
jgi:hypothetical protein